MQSLTEKYRPASFDDMSGQKAITGQTGILRKMLEQNRLSSCIFYGKPGCGKTTAAKIMAENTGLPFISLNATNASVKDIQKAAADHDKCLICLDEIHYFNKKQQQSLLPFIEAGNIVLIATTTDNPYYCCYDALLSRCSIIEFKPVSTDDISEMLEKIASSEQIDITPAAIKMIAGEASGDMRRAINLLETASLNRTTITEQYIDSILPTARMSGFDTDGDYHYGLISGLQKSIRGSDPNAAIFYLARLLEGGDILSPCRRLMVIAHEDIGLGQPDAIPFTYACCEMAKQLGLPEAEKPLTNAVIYLAISPKCDTAEKTYEKARADIRAGLGGTIPPYLAHANAKNYLYPHNYPNHWVPQQYMPSDIASHYYYEPGDNNFEQTMAAYWSNIMKRQK